MKLRATSLALKVLALSNNNPCCCYSWLAFIKNYRINFERFPISNSFIFETITFLLFWSDKGTTAILTSSVSFQICLYSFTLSKSMLKFSLVSRFSTLYHDLNFLLALPALDNTFAWMKSFSLSNRYSIVSPFDGQFLMVWLLLFYFLVSVFFMQAS